MTPAEVSLIVALVQAGITGAEEIIKAVESTRANGDPWAALSQERVESILPHLRLPVDAAALAIPRAA